MQMRRTLIRIVAVALLLYSLWSLASVRVSLYHALEQEQNLKRELEVLQQEAGLLESRLEQGFDDDFLEALARERLGLVRSGEIIFRFNQK